MALPKYSIGEQNFFTLSGPPEKPVQHVEVIARPGVNGIGAYRMGKFGRPFTLRSGVDLENYQAALQRLDDYQEMIAKDPVTAVWADQNFDTGRQAKVIVLDVRLSYAPMKMLTCVGGINVNNGQPCVWLGCDWDLISLTSS